MSINQNQIEAVLKLSPPKRYDHFIKKAVGWGKVWGLYDDGWAMSKAETGEMVLPLWPELEYAQLCATGDWVGYVPKEILLDELLDDLLPTLQERQVLPGVFFTVGDGSVAVSIEQLAMDMRQEMSKYE